MTSEEKPADQTPPEGEAVEEASTEGKQPDQQQISDRETERGLPAWAKVLIGLVVVVILGTGGLIVGGTIFFKNAMKSDPASVEKLANSMMEIDNPLPDNWKYAFGIDAGLVKTFVMIHDSAKESENQIIYFASMPSNSETKETPDSMAEKMMKMGLRTPDTTASFENVKQKGTETIAGIEMPYITGTMVARDGKKFSGMTACLVNQEKKKAIFIYGIQYNGEDYNLDVTNRVLKAIKKI